MADEQIVQIQELSGAAMSWQKMLYDTWKAVFMSNGDQSLQRQARENKEHVTRMLLVLYGPDGKPEEGIVTQVHALTDFTKTIKKLMWLVIAAVLASLGDAGLNMCDHISRQQAVQAPQIYIQRESGTTNTDQDGQKSYSTTESNTTQTTTPAKGGK